MDITEMRMESLRIAMQTAPAEAGTQAVIESASALLAFLKDGSVGSERPACTLHTDRVSVSVSVSENPQRY